MPAISSNSEMASPNPESESSSNSMFMAKEDKPEEIPSRPETRNASSKLSVSAETITVKDFFDFMKTAYQVYEHLEGEEDESTKINWEELTKLTVINHVIEQHERDLLFQTVRTEPKPITSKSDSTLEKKSSENALMRVEKRYSCSEIEGTETFNSDI